MVGSWLRSLPHGVKVILATIGFSVASSFALFAFFLPLIIEHRLISYRFNVWYVWNFFYSMSLYFVVVACFAAYVYLLTGEWRPEARIFVITFFTTFWGIVGTWLTAIFYSGTPGDPLIVMKMWASWVGITIFLFFSFYLLGVSALAVLAYRVYKFVHASARIFLALSVTAFLLAFVCISMLIRIFDLRSFLLVAFFAYCISLTTTAVFNKRVQDMLEKKGRRNEESCFDSVRDSSINRRCLRGLHLDNRQRFRQPQS